MIDSAELHRDVGKHDAQIEALQQQVNRLHQDLSSVISKLEEINQTLSEAKGGWRTLMMVAGIASAVTAAGTKIVAWFLR